MKIHTTNYKNTFIVIAEDCPAIKGEVPPTKDEKPTVAALQYEILKNNPYKFTSDDIVFKIFSEKNEISKETLIKARETYFSKGQPCLRTSPLAKRYGWGIHFNDEGKVAIYSYGSNAYNELLNDEKLNVVNAMKSSK